jgi:hypothetical protein
MNAPGAGLTPPPLRAPREPRPGRLLPPSSERPAMRRNRCGPRPRGEGAARSRSAAVRQPGEEPVRARWPSPAMPTHATAIHRTLLDGCAVSAWPPCDPDAAAAARARRAGCAGRRSPRPPARRRPGLQRAGISRRPRPQVAHDGRRSGRRSRRVGCWECVHSIVDDCSRAPRARDRARAADDRQRVRLHPQPLAAPSWPLERSAASVPGHRARWLDAMEYRARRRVVGSTRPVTTEGASS